MSELNIIVVSISLAVFIIAFSVFIISVINAPEGYEDENGFHIGKQSLDKENK